MKDMFYGNTYMIGGITSEKCMDCMEDLFYWRGYCAVVYDLYNPKFNSILCYQSYINLIE